MVWPYGTSFVGLLISSAGRQARQFERVRVRVRRLDALKYIKYIKLVNPSAQHYLSSCLHTLVPLHSPTTVRMPPAANKKADAAKAAPVGAKPTAPVADKSAKKPADKK